jgi:Metallo-peptidase family M12B Reprolysin-like
MKTRRRQSKTTSFHPSPHVSPTALQLLLVSVCLIVAGIFLLHRGDWKASANNLARVANGQASADGIWQATDDLTVQSQGEHPPARQLRRMVQLNPQALIRLLAQAPMELTDEARRASVVMTLPMPDGSFARFRIEESPIMEPELAARFPNIKTYQGQGVDDPTATARFDWTPSGFHAIIVSAQSIFHVEPFSEADAASYITYDSRLDARGRASGHCAMSENDQARAGAFSLHSRQEEMIRPTFVSGSALRTYRLAVAATAEYTQGFGMGDVNRTLDAIVQTVNGINATFQREASIKLMLVNNETAIIFTNAATAGYTNGDTGKLLDENQAKLDAVIGSANYDIGHVFARKATGGWRELSARLIANRHLERRQYQCRAGECRKSEDHAVDRRRRHLPHPTDRAADGGQ